MDDGPIDRPEGDPISQGDAPPPPAPSDGPVEFNKPEKQPWYETTFGRVAGGAVALFVVIGLFGGLDEPEEPDSTPVAEEAESEAEEQPEPSPEPSPEPLTLQEQLAEEIGNRNRDDVPLLATSTEQIDDFNDYVVTWPINDNLTVNFIRIGAADEMADMLQVLLANPAVPDDIDRFAFVGTIELVDELGNAEEGRVIDVRIPVETAEQINFENFIAENLYEIDPNAFIHPALRDDE